MAKLKLIHRIAVRLTDLISKTWRIRFAGNPVPSNGIIIFWHGYLLAALNSIREMKPLMIVSLSKDGEIVAELLRIWGYKLIRGSSSKDGKEAMKQICDSAPKELVAITPDGPTGPNQRMKPGAVVAAYRSGSPIYLLSVKITKYHSFIKSWDKFRFPYPFARIVATVSEPIHISAEASREDIDSLIIGFENRLNDMYSE
jgi:lysophospholipid acyltransferase (LPLAT)-like uncharacterized protein